jgi:hypothetical protein
MIANGLTKDENNLGSFKVDSFFAELVRCFSISKTGSEEPFFFVPSIVYACPLPSSYMRAFAFDRECVPFALDHVCAFCLHRIVLVPSFLALLSSEWNSYSVICEHTGRSPPVRRNQLPFLCDGKSANSNLFSFSNACLGFN